jgi:3-hydroxymyristoyl/3-hydroxydecanoyl-(acyl carrier protein) dehydratase
MTSRSAAAAGSRIEARVLVPANHPSLPGHFPGQPVVPGVLLLERLVEAAEQAVGAPLRVTGMPQVKFVAPLLPDEEALAVMELAPDSLRFRVERDGQTIAQGAFQLAGGGEALSAAGAP